MKLRSALRVKPGSRVKLSDWDPDATPGYRDRNVAEKTLVTDLARIDALQYRLYAEHQRALLIVLQGMDASGKDGVVRHVMAGFNPEGCDVWPFKAPTTEELDHDFLWRIHRAVPPRGGIAIFNRSHYEDVLIVRVREMAPREVWKARYDQINAFEQHLVDNGVTVIKFFLHISKAEQKRRLQARLDDPTRQWKFNPGDLEERKHWKEYVEAYEAALTRCSTDAAPWFIIPANHKWYRNSAVASLVIETLEDMDPKLPKVKIDPRKFKID